MKLVETEIREIVKYEYESIIEQQEHIEVMEQDNWICDNDGLLADFVRGSSKIFAEFYKKIN